MNFVIWGAGQKGRIALKVMGKDRVSCFIDSNSMLYTTPIDGKKVIPFEDYLTNYKDSLIIVSMLDCKDVVSKLKDNNVPYILWEKSSGYLENNDNNIAELAELIKKKLGKERLILWGVNILSILLYDMLLNCDVKISFALDKEEVSLNEILSKNGYVFNDKSAERVIVTDNGWKEAIIRYANYRIVSIYDLFREIFKEKYAPLVEFNNIHKGQKCFVIGNGPSLKVEDLNILHSCNEICFGTNMIYKAFAKTDWRPTYYVASDMVVLEKYGEQIKQLPLSCFFIGNRRTGFWKGFSDARFHVFYDYRCLDMDIPPFSDNIMQCVYSYYTVTYTCLQLAMYMGFKEIYLLGIDANYNGYASDENNHFIDDYYDNSDRQKMPIHIERHFRAYQVAQRYANAHGVKIYNATRGGKLEVFERVDFNRLF